MPRSRDHKHMQALGQRLRARRQWLRRTMQDVAAAADVTYQQVQKYESGLNDPPAALLVKFARVLETTPHALLGWDGDDRTDSFSIDVEKLLADPNASAIIRRLARMDGPHRKLTHALVCAAESGGKP